MTLEKQHRTLFRELFQNLEWVGTYWNSEFSHALPLSRHGASLFRPHWVLPSADRSHCNLPTRLISWIQSSGHALKGEVNIYHRARFLQSSQDPRSRGCDEGKMDLLSLRVLATCIHLLSLLAGHSVSFGPHSVGPCPNYYSYYSRRWPPT